MAVCSFIGVVDGMSLVVNGRPSRLTICVVQGVLLGRADVLSVSAVNYAFLVGEWSAIHVNFAAVCLLLVDPVSLNWNQFRWPKCE